MGSDNIDDIKKYYDSAVEIERPQLHQLEFTITKKILSKHIHKPSTILELGSGNGYYTEFLAKKGHHVTAVELSPVLHEQNQKNIIGQKLENKVNFFCEDARNVLQITNNKFDFILVMGPFYHLVKHTDRTQLMSDLAQRLNPGGQILSSFLTRLGLISYMLVKYPQWIQSPNREAWHLWKKGDNVDHPRNGVFRGYFFQQEQISQLHEVAGLKIVQQYSQDPGIGGADEIYNRLPDELKEKWSEFLFELSSDSNSWGSGRTLMTIAEIK